MFRWFESATLLLVILVLAGLAPANDRKAIRVLILSGRNDHDWRTSTPHLRKVLADTGRFDIRVNEEPSGVTPESLKPNDAVVLNYNGVRWGATPEKALEDFVRSGKGLVTVHGASYAFAGLEVLGDNHERTGIVEPAWKGYADMLGASWSTPGA